MGDGFQYLQTVEQILPKGAQKSRDNADVSSAVRNMLVKAVLPAGQEHRFSSPLCWCINQQQHTPGIVLAAEYNTCSTWVDGWVVSLSQGWGTYGMWAGSGLLLNFIWSAASLGPSPPPGLALRAPACPTLSGKPQASEPHCGAGATSASSPCCGGSPEPP